MVNNYPFFGQLWLLDVALLTSGIAMASGTLTQKSF